VRIVVTGAAGFIGSHLSRALLDQEHDVVGIDAFIPYYPRWEKERNLRAIVNHPRFSFHEADLRTDSLDLIVEGADVVINQAATAGLMLSWEDLELYASCNILGLQRILEACRRVPGLRRFIQASTSSVYGADAVGDESVPTRPVSPYGVTKLAAEHLCRAYQIAHGLPIVTLRYFSVYGPGQRPDMAYRIFIDALLRGAPITVYGDGLQSRSNTYVDDCVRGTIAAVERAEPGDVYNIGGGAELTVRNAIKLLAEMVGAEPNVRHAAARDGDQKRTAADISHARSRLGYEPIVKPEVGLAAQVEWQRQLAGDAEHVGG
jgi:UDP-glucuronate 4-epimerase